MPKGSQWKNRTAEQTFSTSLSVHSPPLIREWRLLLPKRSPVILKQPLLKCHTRSRLRNTGYKNRKTDRGETRGGEEGVSLRG